MYSFRYIKYEESLLLESFEFLGFANYVWLNFSAEGDTVKQKISIFDKKFKTVLAAFRSSYKLNIKSTVRAKNYRHINSNLNEPIFNQCSTSKHPENIIKPLLILSGCIEVGHWLKMGQSYTFFWLLDRMI